MPFQHMNKKFGWFLLHQGFGKATTEQGFYYWARHCYVENVVHQPHRQCVAY